MSNHLGVAVAFCAACGTSQTTPVVTGDPVDDAEAQGDLRGQELAAQISLELTGDQRRILAQTGSLLAALNAGEIEQGATALGLVQRPDIFLFANDLIARHEEAAADLDSVMRVYGLAFVPSQAEANLAADAAAGVALLRATSPDRVDFAFVELQVRMHAAALLVLDQLNVMIESGPMIDYIANMHVMVDDHLAHAKLLLATLR